MNKRKLGKKMSLNKETLLHLQADELQKAGGQQAEAATSFNSRCVPTCGPDSCLGFCSLNCSFLAC